MSKSQEQLEQASKAVGAACRSLVRQVQALIKERIGEDEKVDYSKLGSHEFKVREMEQQVCLPSSPLVHIDARHIILIFASLQVEILQLENALNAARSRLGEMRKISYQEE